MRVHKKMYKGYGNFPMIMMIQSKGLLYRSFVSQHILDEKWRENNIKPEKTD